MENSIKSAIILAGGRGTRLKNVVHDVPKVLASINEKPFLEIILDQLAAYDIKQVILSVGYMSQSIINYFGPIYKNMNIAYSNEHKPLGTGGAVAKAIKYMDNESFLLLNGDSYFNIDLNKIVSTHMRNNCMLTCSSKWQKDASRYGTIEIHQERIHSFREKGVSKSGYINGGVYVLSQKIIEYFPKKDSFSFEKEVLEKYAEKKAFCAEVFSDFFIDIGIPNDYTLMDILLRLKSIQWTLFLDRDGVINRNRNDDYIKSWQEFEFMPGVLDGFHILNRVFHKVFIVTNQQGVSKGLMSEESLKTIHGNMKAQIRKNGGELHGIYYCPDLESENSQFRKPNTGMAHLARSDHPEIQFNRCLMIGDSTSDMEFAKNCGMRSILISEETQTGDDLTGARIVVLRSLSQFIEILQEFFATP